MESLERGGNELCRREGDQRRQYERTDSEQENRDGELLHRDQTHEKNYCRESCYRASIVLSVCIFFPSKLQDKYEIFICILHKSVLTRIASDSQQGSTRQGMHMDHYL